MLLARFGQRQALNIGVRLSPKRCSENNFPQLPYFPHRSQDASFAISIAGLLEVVDQMNARGVKSHWRGRMVAPKAWRCSKLSSSIRQGNTKKIANR